MQRDYDVAVVGGGLVGAAVAWGLARGGQRVVVLDEGDIAKRASRANFALIWVQSKGLGMAEYMGWTVRSSEAWRELSAELMAQTGLDVCFRRPGGFTLALGEAELEARAQLLKRLHNQTGAAETRAEIVDRGQVERMLPGLISGWALAFINSFDEVTMTVFIAAPGTETLPVRMFLYIQDNIDPLVTSVSACVIAVTVLALIVLDRAYGLERLLVGRSADGG